MSHVVRLPPSVPADPMTSGITKNQWRGLFTSSEQFKSDKVSGQIDGDLSFPSFSVDDTHLQVPGHTYRDVLRTGYSSFNEATTVDTLNASTQLMVNTMELVGIIGPDRAAEILKGVSL